MGRTLIVLSVVSLSLASCGESGGSPYQLQKVRVGTSSGPVVEVMVPAGFSLQDSGADGDGYLPLPANLGVLRGTTDQEVRVLVLSDALAVGSTLEVNPVAAVQFDRDGTLEEYFVAVPSDEQLRKLPVNDLADLMTEYESARYIIQTWCVNHAGFGALTLRGWKDEKYASSRLVELAR